MAECAICNKKVGGFGGLVPADFSTVTEYKAHFPDAVEPICVHCIVPFITEIRNKGRLDHQQKMDEIVKKVKMFTINPFQPGSYEYMGLVTAYAAIGTGVVVEFLSTFTDMFGEESKSYNKKMNEATDICISRIRSSALEMGANAVIGLQTTFTELTAGKGQILVCMIGTAVKVKEQLKADSADPAK